jgi:hypothetical protein
MCIFALSRQATAARGGEDLPGISWTLGVLSLIFLASAAVTERSRGPEANMQKDLLWGLGAGAAILVMLRVLSA